MKYALRFASLLLISAVALSACGKGSSTATNPQTNKPALDAAASPSPSASPEVAPSASPSATTASGQSYQEKSGLFEIAFPEGYTYEETGSGIAFVSKDQGFGGSVDFGSSQGAELSNEQLEQALKKEYENRLKDIKWQETKPQPDGSVRVDWVGKDPSGNQLDAVSFVEQRGDNIFILNLFGVNKSYQDYNSDAEQIVSTYKVKQP
ncbi:hypothetical protein IFO70_02890 [Phormidium tenue FACHB-886]|nr:hypothetical protein [Phormidium tenue FACHB-886]